MRAERHTVRNVFRLGLSLSCEGWESLPGIVSSAELECMKGMCRGVEG